MALKDSCRIDPVVPVVDHGIDELKLIRASLANARLARGACRTAAQEQRTHRDHKQTEGHRAFHIFLFVGRAVEPVSCQQTFSSL